MNRGFVVVAQNTPDVDYIKCAEVLGMSLKKFMPNESCTLITDDIKKSKYFDKVVKLPYGDLAPNSNWKLINDWQVYEASPYQYSIKIEADIFIPKDISYWFDVLKQKEVIVSTTIRNFKNEISDVKIYRRFIEDNTLPNVYNALTYFKKSDFAEKFFAIVRNVFENWQDYKNIFQCDVKEQVTTDWAYAIACHILGEEHTTMPSFTDMSMIHMKQFINGVHTENWTDTLIYECLPSLIRIHTVPQLYPLHYNVKTFSEKIYEAFK